MAINKKAKAEAEKSAALSIEVKSAKDFSKEEGTAISFTMVVNGVTIYNCWYREGKKKDGSDYSMVSFPSRKAENGEYYNHAWVKLSDEDVDNISKQIEALL